MSVTFGPDFFSAAPATERQQRTKTVAIIMFLAKFFVQVFSSTVIAQRTHEEQSDWPNCTPTDRPSPQARVASYMPTFTSLTPILHGVSTNKRGGKVLRQEGLWMRLRFHIATYRPGDTTSNMSSFSIVSFHMSCHRVSRVSSSY